MARKKKRKNNLNSSVEVVNSNNNGVEKVDTVVEVKTINEVNKDSYDKTQDLSAIEMREYDLETLERMRETLTSLLSDSTNDTFSRYDRRNISK